MIALLQALIVRSMKLFQRTAAVIAMALSLAPVAADADNAQAEAAYDRGELAEAMVIWLAVAEEGDAAAQYNVATLLRKGEGVPRDAAAAASWYEQAAQQGHHHAQVNLGRLYLEGDGVKRDLGRAFHWFDEAAHADFPPAQYYLATLYESGAGVLRDIEQAKALYEVAAEAGLGAAAYRLSRLYDQEEMAERNYGQSEMGERNPRLARKWLVRGAVAGYPEAQLGLAELYRNGEGEGPNLVLAYFWAMKAERSGMEKATTMRRQIGERMTPAQKRELIKMAKMMREAVDRPQRDGEE